MVVTRLDDQNDEMLADYRNVPDPELVLRRGLFVAEGRLVVRRLLSDHRLKVRSVLVTEPALGSIADVLAQRPELPVYLVAQRTMNAIVGFNIHRGCLAVGERPPTRDWRGLTAAARRLVVLERIGDADNVGTIFRSAAAFAADAVLLGPACADPLYRKAIRTSMGAALAVPFARADGWPAALRELGAMGHTVIGLTPGATRPLRDVVEETRGGPTTLVLGHEGDGLTSEALAACSRTARIDIATAVDSLNVAAAAAIALYELAR